MTPWHCRDLKSWNHAASRTFGDISVDASAPGFEATLASRDWPGLRLARAESPEAHVRAVLGDWQTWSSAQSIGLNPVINQAWKNALICVGPPLHTGMRKLFTDRLGPRQIKDVEDAITRRADALAARIAAAGKFDAVKDVAQDLPVGVIMDLIG